MVWDRKPYDMKWRNKNREKVRAAQARWRKKYRKQIRDHGREYRKTEVYKIGSQLRDLRNRYGLTPVQYKAMLDTQNGGCAICAKTPMENKKRLSVDHCHLTKKVRGLLCYKCNTGIAYLGDNPEIIKKAFGYLQAITKAEGK